jgi:alanyl aminopeptidase
VVEAAMGSLWRVWHVAVEGRPDVEAAFATLVRDALGARGRELGLMPRAGESEDDQLLRPAVIGILAELGEDPGIQTEASRLATRWLDAPGKVPLPAAQLALPIAAHHGDAALHARLVSALALLQAPSERVLALSALGSFRDTGLLKNSLALYFRPDLQASDFFPIAGPASGRAATRAEVLRFVESHFKELSAKLGDELTARLPGVGSGACSEDGRDRLRAMFEDRDRLRPGSQRTLAQAIESIETCAAVRARIAEGVQAVLQAPRR